MAGYPSSPNEGDPGMESLLSSLRRSSNTSARVNAPAIQSSSVSQFGVPADHFSPPQFTQSPPHTYNDTGVSSPPPTLPISNPPSRHSSVNMSPFGNVASQTPNLTFGQSSSVDTTANLLGLLKFSQPDVRLQSQQTPIGPPQTSSRDPTIITTSNSRGTPDLLASLMTSARPSENQKPFETSDSASSVATGSAAGPSRVPSDTQALLLRLLNRPSPKPAQHDSAPAKESPKNPTRPSDSPSRTEVSDVTRVLKETTLGKRPEYESDDGKTQPTSTAEAKSSKGLFTYVNPFEELTASIPNRNSTSPFSRTQASPAPPIQILKPPRNDGGDKSELKRKTEDSTPSPSPAHARRKVASTVSTPSLLGDGRTPTEPLIGIGSFETDKESALNDQQANPKASETITEAPIKVGGQIDKQTEKSLARTDADKSQATIDKYLPDMLNSKINAEAENSPTVEAVAIQQALKKEASGSVLENVTAGPVTDAVREMSDSAIQKNTLDSWESEDAAETSAKEDPDSPTIKVFNFPLKPFSLITLASGVEHMHPGFRDESIMDIARLKKDFDQVDRTLVTATTSFIMYGMSKNGGIRVIRQDDGKDVKLFTDSRDRIFNLSASSSSSPTNRNETVIGTGVSGTVYWAPIKGSDGDYIEGLNPENRGFSLPPIQPSGEELAGGVLKTRARKSSSHPEFFAVGRGRYLHIIWPSIITTQAYLKDGKERVVDTDKYLTQRSLKINTGKAGKDFTFSHDDTAIVSLDKAGRVKFWDVRTLTSRSNELRFPVPEQIQPVEIKEPLWTLMTTHPNEKSWPTSVMFVDKLRPYLKGGAQRYLVVGMKQNHSLQLWDLLLGKPVQELHLPHNNESDAVCSIAYHPGSSMLIIGHPTRNSIYFVHLSSPKYNLPKFLTQAEFTEKLAAKDPMLPKPDATAVMSGIREYSFEKKGLLRSLDILQSPSSASENDDDPVLFELYAMHSKGVTCLAIRNEDLGWNSENRVILGANAEEVGLVTVKTLKEIPPTPANEVASNTPSTSPAAQASRTTTKDTAPKVPARKSAASNGHSPMPHAAKLASSSPYAENKTESTPEHAANGGQDSAASGADKKEKRNKKKQSSSVRFGSQDAITGEASSVTSTRAQAAIGVSKEADTTALSGGRSIEVGHSAVMGGSASLPDPAAEVGALRLSQQDIDGFVKRMEGSVSSEVSKLFAGSVEQIYQRFDSDKRTQAAESDSKQKALLQVVSTTLTDNLDKTLAANMATNIKNILLPTLSEVVTKTIHDQFGAKHNSQIKSALDKELHSVLPDAIAKALQNPEQLKSLSDSLVKVVSARFEEQLLSAVEKKIVPTFANLAVQQLRVATDSLQRQRQEDGVKIQELARQVQTLGTIISDMAAAQAKFQAEILKSREQDVQERQRANTMAGSKGPSAPTQPTAAQVQLDEAIKGISGAMDSGKVEEAVMRWLQSSREQEIFELYFSKFNPAFIREVNPLMLLSVAATVSAQLESKVILERLSWLEIVFHAFQSAASHLEDQIRDVTPKIFGIVISRLEQIFMRVSQISAQDPLLKRLSALVISAKAIVENARRA